MRAPFRLVACGVALLMTGLFSLRGGRSDAGYFHELAFQEFAATYINRNHLTEKFPERFPGQWTEAAHTAVYKSVIPKASTPLDLIRLYPGELYRNILYNTRTSFKRVLPAMFLSLDRRVLMLVAFAFNVVSFGFWRERQFGSREDATAPTEIRMVLIVWVIASALIIQVVPVIILLETLAARRIIAFRIALSRLPR